MLKRTLMTAFAALGASLSFGYIHPAAMVGMKPMFVDGPSNVLRITEMLVNPQGTDDGNEYFEITNTGANDVELKDVYLLYIDGESSQNGEVDAVVRLGTGANRDQTRVLAAGATIVFRDVETDLNPDAPQPISPQGGTVVELNFETTTGIGDAMRNSLGLFALISAPTISAGDTLDDNGDGILDSSYWTDTFHAVDLKRASDESGSEFYYSDAGLPDAGSDGYNRVKCRQMSSWTPDGFSLLKRNSSGAWDNALMYDTNTKNGSNQFTFDGNEYVFGVSTGLTDPNDPVTTSGSPMCTPGLISQFQVKDGATGSITWTH